MLANLMRFCTKLRKSQIKRKCKGWKPVINKKKIRLVHRSWSYQDIFSVLGKINITNLWGNLQNK